MSRKRTIIISNRLPVRIEKINGELQFLPSEGGLATGLGSIYKKKGNIWIGWPGYIPENEKEKKIIIEKLSEMSLIPVFLTQEQLKGYYEGFSNEILWPIFHYRLSYAIYNESYWFTYKEVNELFLSRISALEINSKDEIWVHDYQLMLLPNLIREYNRELSISYFQHIPFPPDEVFRCIPWRDELLEGLLGADLIAFHTFTDAKHFRNACVNLLELSYENHRLHMRDRDIFIEVFPMGIDFDKFNELAQKKEVQKKAKQIKKSFRDRKLIVSVDRLDYSKGILMRLHGYEKLLKTYPALHKKVVLYMLVVPSRDTVEQYKHLLDEIDRLVGHINSVYGDNEWRPIAYFYTSIPIQDLSALYLASDICIVSSLRDGMNLVSKEYIATKAHQKEGVLILSELAGASKELTDSLLINPNSEDDIMQALHLAIHMPASERRKRMENNAKIVQKFNIHHWIKIFFIRFREIKAAQKKHITKKITPKVRAELFKKYSQAKNRLLFLDYDGTLVGFQKDTDKALPTSETFALLGGLKQKEGNQLIIVSGRSYHELDSWFSDKVDYLVAEHGSWTTFPDKKWQSKSNLNTRWKIPVKRIMHRFTNLTPGAHIEEKSFSLAWHYRRAEKGHAQMRVKELIERLRYLLMQYDLELLEGNKVVEVKNSGLNKGSATSKIVKAFDPDFILAIGDDVTDEDMFYALPATAVTIKVGSEHSAARYYVESQEDAVELLKYFAQN